MRFLLLAFALAACGQDAGRTAPEAGSEMAGGMDLSGRLIAIGPDFRLDSGSDIGVVLVYPQHDQTVSGPYAAPEATATGAMLESGGISLTLTPGACMHEGAAYPMHASVTIPNARPAEGCALIRWDRHLLALAPQIDACLAQASNARWVSYAGETQGATLVRFRGEAGAFDCRVVGAAAVEVRPRDEGIVVAGENEAIFVRGPGVQPGGECYQAPEVRAANGELLGWMADPMGC